MEIYNLGKTLGLADGYLYKNGRKCCNPKNVVETVARKLAEVVVRYNKGLFKLSPALAIKYFRKKKGNKLTWDWYELWQDAYKRILLLLLKL